MVAKLPSLNHLSKPLEDLSRIHLGQEICFLQIGRNVENFNFSTLDNIPEEMPLDLEISSPASDALVVGQKHSTVVVLEDG